MAEQTDELLIATSSNRSFGPGSTNASTTVEARGDWIDVHSELGNSITIEFTLPAA